MKHLVLTALLALGAAASAQTPVTVQDAWVRGTVAQQHATGAFMRLTAAQPARLVQASSPVAGVTEIHEMAMDNNVMRMRQIAGLDLAAGQTVELKPGGLHVMLMDLKQPLQAGQNVPITLVFEDANRLRHTQQIVATVRALAGGHGGGHGGGGGHGHGGGHRH
jgi:copper(I)-binding protein